MSDIRVIRNSTETVDITRAVNWIIVGAVVGCLLLGLLIARAT